MNYTASKNTAAATIKRPIEQWRPFLRCILGG